MTIRQRPRRAQAKVDYPDNDGKPMAESPIHRDDMMRGIQTLQDAFAERADVYVSGNMMFYYEEGNPRAFVSPDVFVVKGVPKLPERRVYKLWEEGVAPAMALEVTSRSTRRVDLGKKRDTYARIGVREYLLYDPLAEYLRPPLQGFRLHEGEYHPIAPDADGALMSEELDMRLKLVDGRLRFFDRRTGAPLLSPSERAADAEARAAAAERRIAELEARLAQRQDD